MHAESLADSLKSLALGYVAWLGVVLGVAIAALGITLLVIIIGILIMVIGYLLVVISGYLIYRGGREAWRAYASVPPQERSDLAYAGAIILRYSGLAAFIGAIALIIIVGAVILAIAYIAYTIGAALYTAGLALAAAKLGASAARTPLLLAAAGAVLDLLGFTAIIGLILFLVGTLIASSRLRDAVPRVGVEEPA